MTITNTSQPHPELITGSIQIWRQKQLEGTLTVEDMKAVIRAIKNTRTAAAESSAVSKVKKSKTKVTPVDSSALLDDFLGL